MNLQEIKTLIESVEAFLTDSPFAIALDFERNHRKIHVGLTEKLRRRCKSGKVWKSKQFLTALKNAQYGFDEVHARSPGGSDGIFVLTRDHRPKNEMMKKIFDRFLDNPSSEAKSIAEFLGTGLDELIPVRLVSHHMRLLGVLFRDQDGDKLILVDYDNSENK